MKILITTHTQYGKNAFSKHFERASSLAKRGHDVMFLITSSKNNWRVSMRKKQNVTIIESPDWFWGRLRQGVCPFNLLVRSLIILKLDFDLIHCIDSRPVTIIPGIIAKYIRGKYLFVEWTDLFGRGGIISERSSRLYQMTCAWFEVFFEEKFRRFADGAMAISKKLRSLLLHLGYPDERIILLPLASNVDRISAKKQADIKKELGLSENIIYLTYVGSLYEKDKLLLLSVFSLLRESYKDELQLILIGRHQWLDDGNRAEGIIATGFVNDEMLYDYLRASDLLLLPLRTSVANMARFPCKINDYFVAGRPVVSTPISDVPELHKKYCFGAIATSDSPLSFSSAVMTMIAQKDKWDYFGKEGQRCAQEQLSMEVLAKRMERFYNKIMEMPKK